LNYNIGGIEMLTKKEINVIKESIVLSIEKHERLLNHLIRHNPKVEDIKDNEEMKKYFENKIAFRQKLQKKINKEFS
jgi:hypothetical protein